MTKSITNVCHSIRTRLLNIAKREGSFFQTILTRYFHERLLYRIANSQFCSQFYLKGGALMYALNSMAARPTLDVDLLGVNIDNSHSNIIHAFKAICECDYCDDGVTFDAQKIEASSITEFKDYVGVRLTIPVQMDTIQQRISIDIGFGDVVTPGPIRIDYPRLINDLPCASLFAYPIETLFAEKLHAVIELGSQNSRMKDYYDLYNLLQNVEVGTTKLQRAVNCTFTARHTSYSPSASFFQPDFANNNQLAIRWNAFIRKLGLKDAPSFGQVVTTIQQQTLHLWTEYGLYTKQLHN